MPEDFEPKTRNEALLNAIRENTGGGTGSVDFEPRTRNEYLLNEIRKNTEGGGSGLPDVTSADNGKVLGVDDGEWFPTVSTIIINGTMTSQTGGTWTSEYTSEDIAIAFAHGVRVIVNVPGVASVNIEWIDTNQYMYALVYMDGLGIVVVEASDVGGAREFLFTPVS